jgi:hypothetical protein
MPEKPKSTAAKQPASTTRAKATGAKKKTTAGDPAKYTKPELRERIKKKVVAGDKGGRPGQWSARKAQLVASEYVKEGGAYKEGGRSTAQKHLQSWTEEHWKTADGQKAIQGKTTSRYLPEKAWDKLSPAEKKATDRKKKTVSKTGQQFVPNTAAAKRARRESTEGTKPRKTKEKPS